MNPDDHSSHPLGPHLNRREFIQWTGTAAALASTAAPFKLLGQDASTPRQVIHFPKADSLTHGAGWETLNPGYWQTKNGALRRRLTNVGERARATGFPFHSATRGRVMKTDYDPSLPTGIIYRNEWKMKTDFAVTAKLTYHGKLETRRDGDSADWKMYQPGYGLMGLAFGAKSLFESYTRARHVTLLGWSDNAQFAFTGRHVKQTTETNPRPAPQLEPGDEVTIHLEVSHTPENQAIVKGTLSTKQSATKIQQTLPSEMARGYFGLAGRGLVDFELRELTVTPRKNTPLTTAETDCLNCYPLGDTLTNKNGKWHVKFVSLFASDGEQVEIRIAPTSHPSEGWNNVPAAGTAAIVNHDWRRNTAIVTAQLPLNPAEATLYYTVWKDGVNVTSDPRIGSGATGPGTGLVGDVPATGDYVGRLPQLKAPYKLCGLSCHAITSGLQQRTETGFAIQGGGGEWQWRDQPTREAYQHLEDYHFQVMVWEDDVWYMELAFYPPSTDDAYKVVKNSICGPTTRWQMMRHWNVINPGDHDYGMDDVKGPEQIAIRNVPGLGQDPEYMRRNFQIVHHLITGSEQVDGRINPKKWRAWKMPNRDFTFVILDSRLWRSSQDVDMWDDAGWDAFKSLYDRKDPTRSLLGEEQFAWLQQLVTTDSSPLICLTGINGLHTIWAGSRKAENPFDQRSRVVADYAGWVKAGADRVLELLGSRSGIVSVYGDVHNGCIMKNKDERVIECSFGPIGRSGGRALIPGFGPRMKDWDGRDVDITALYHSAFSNPEQAAHRPEDPFYWNFLEMEFDPTKEDPAIGLRIRNLIDPPTESARGGGSLETHSNETGRPARSRLPELTTLPNADVRIVHTDGRPIRGTRSRPDGTLVRTPLADIQPNTKLILTAFDGVRSRSTVVSTERV